MASEKYIREYQKAIRFAADFKGADYLLSPESLTDHDRWGGPKVDHTKRGVIADYLQDLGRDEEAELLRGGHHVVVHDGQVKKGRYTLRHLREALDAADEGVFGLDALPTTDFRWAEATSHPSVDFFTTEGARYGDWLADNGHETEATRDHHLHPEHAAQVQHEDGKPVVTLIDDTCHAAECPIHEAGKHWANEYLENHLGWLQEHAHGMLGRTFTEDDARRARSHPLVEAVRKAPVDEPLPE